MIDNRTAWFLMELPSLLLFGIIFLSGGPVTEKVKWVFFSVWLIHYGNRVLIFPARTRTKGKKMPMVIMLMAMAFNLVNSFINAYWLGHIAGGTENGAGSVKYSEYYVDWFTDPRFIAGISLFAIGFLINQLADNHLIHLREKKGSGYYIPTHWLYRRISCPNFGGEILEWIGFAVMTWSLAGLSFAVWTAVNLIPRALHHHLWYRNTFSDYPQKRKAIIPGIL